MLVGGRWVGQRRRSWRQNQNLDPQSLDPRDGKFPPLIALLLPSNAPLERNWAPIVLKTRPLPLVSIFPVLLYQPPPHSIPHSVPFVFRCISNTHHDQHFVPCHLRPLLRSLRYPLDFRVNTYRPKILASVNCWVLVQPCLYWSLSGRLSCIDLCSVCSVLLPPSSSNSVLL